jgi:hypothetical protein
VYESSSENAASPQRLTGEDAVMTDIFNGSKQPSQQPEREPSPVPVVSDIPLVVSDIPQAVNNVTIGPVGLTAPQPQNQTQLSKLMERGAQKRKASPKWVGLHQGCLKEDFHGCASLRIASIWLIFVGSI